MVGQSISPMDLLVIQNNINEVRGARIMLDFDRAALYGVQTRVFNQAVRRNLESFPEDFMFQLFLEKWNILSQTVMTSPKKRPKTALPLSITCETSPY